MLEFALAALLLLFCDACISQDRLVRCQGQTVIKVDDIIGPQTKFDAVFRIDGDSVVMTEGDFFRFAQSYKADLDITRPGRPGFRSENGNLFLFIESGRFQIFKMNYVSGVGLKSESTEGDCKRLEKIDAFK